MHREVSVSNSRPDDREEPWRAHKAGRVSKGSLARFSVELLMRTDPPTGRESYVRTAIIDLEAPE
jgi:hypothetical protein